MVGAAAPGEGVATSVLALKALPNLLKNSALGFSAILPTLF